MKNLEKPTEEKLNYSSNWDWNFAKKYCHIRQTFSRSY